MSVHQWELRQPPSKKQENKVKSQRAETKEASAREERVDIRVGTPKQHIEQLFTTTDYEPMILEHKTFMALQKRPDGFHPFTESIATFVVWLLIIVTPTAIHG